VRFRHLLTTLGCASLRAPQTALAATRAGVRALAVA